MHLSSPLCHQSVQLMRFSVEATQRISIQKYGCIVTQKCDSPGTGARTSSANPSGRRARPDQAPSPPSPQTQNWLLTPSSLSPNPVEREPGCCYSSRLESEGSCWSFHTTNAQQPTLGRFSQNRGRRSINVTTAAPSDTTLFVGGEVRQCVTMLSPTEERSSCLLCSTPASRPD